MYFEHGYRQIIRQLRKQQGLTQAQLSEKVNRTDGVISRIETGAEIPKESTLRKIFECLGEPGFFSTFYYDRENLAFMEIARRMIEHYEFGDIKELEKCLDEFREYLSKDINYKTSAVQFLELMVQLYYKRLTNSESIPKEKLYEILKITFRDCTEDCDLSGVLLDQTEIFLFNNIAIALLSQDDYEKAEDIYLNLVRRLDKNCFFLPSIWKTKAVLYNNLAVCESLKNRHDNAVKLSNKALGCVDRNNGGGKFFILKIQKTNYRIKQNFESSGECTGDFLLIKAMYDSLSKYVKSLNGFSDFMNESCLIEVF